MTLHTLGQMQATADKVYAEHHPVNETKEHRTAAEAKVKQQAQEAELKRQQANTESENTPGATYTPPPQGQVASNRALPQGAADASSPVKSTTGLYANSFTQDLTLVRGKVNQSKEPPVQTTLVPDPCMSDWVLQHLHDYDGTSAYGMRSVCGKSVVLIAGAGGIDEKLMLFGATQSGGPADVRGWLQSNNGANVSFASAASEDGRTVLLIGTAA